MEDIGYFIALLAICEEYRLEEYPYEEETGVTYYRERIQDILIEYYLLTEEEIAQGLADYMETEEKPAYLYEISYERLTTQGD